MGNMKYPIGIQSFEKIITEGYLYIDKTQMIYDMVENGKIYFLSRPRRFGKSLLVSTLECYFQGRKELFKGLAIDNLETDWKQYAVFHLDFNGKDFTQAGQLEKTLIDFVESQEAIYGKAPFASTLGDRFIGVLRNAHEKTGLRAVVLIDEYDKPLLDVLDSTLKTTDADGNERRLEDRHREILKGFYSVFKAADKDLQFVLLTGVTKFSQVSVFSGFNQPEDISLSAHFDTLLGITEDELRSTFSQQIAEMAEEYAQFPSVAGYLQHIVNIRGNGTTVDQCRSLRKLLNKFLLNLAGFGCNVVIFHLRHRKVQLIRSLNIRNLPENVHQLRQIKEAAEPCPGAVTLSLRCQFQGSNGFSEPGGPTVEVNHAHFLQTVIL